MMMKINFILQKVELFHKSHATDYEACESIAKRAKVCYQSSKDGHPINFVRSLVNRGHLAPLEILDIALDITTDRAVANALVRHRHASPMQESTHYINYEKRKQIDIIDAVSYMTDAQYTVWEESIEQAIKAYEELIQCGVKSQIARTVLPLATKTQLNFKANARTWREIILLRQWGTTGADQLQMQDLMQKCSAILIEHFPSIFGDLQYEPFKGLPSDKKCGDCGRFVPIPATFNTGRCLAQGYRERYNLACVKFEEVIEDE